MYIVCFYFYFWHVRYKLRFRVTADGEEDVYTRPVWHAEWTRQVFTRNVRCPSVYETVGHTHVINVKRDVFRSNTRSIFQTFVFPLVCVQDSQRIPAGVAVHRRQSHTVLPAEGEETAVLPSTRPGKHCYL